MNLPTLTVPDLEGALCTEIDSGDMWFPMKGQSNRDAKRICRSCPVLDACLQWALDHDERFGVWGGLSERERRRLRPPKPLEVRTHCAYCDTAFEAAKHARYCSTPCRQAAWRDRRLA